MNLATNIPEMIRNNQTQQAIALCREFLSQEPNHTATKIELANCLMADQQYEGALQLYKSLYQLNPINIAIVNGMLSTAYALEQFDFILSIASVLAMRANIPALAAYTCGKVLKQVERYKEAIPFFEIALKDEQYEDSCRKRIVEMCQADNFELGLSHCFILYQKQPERIENRVNLAYFYMNFDRFEESFELLAPIYDLVLKEQIVDAKHQRLLFRAAFIYYKGGEFKKSSVVSTYIEKLYPQYVKNSFTLGLCLLNQEEFAKGWRQLEKRFDHNDPFSDNPSFSVVAKSLPRITQIELIPYNKILIVLEDSYGDMIQLSRYIPFIAEQGKLKGCQVDILLEMDRLSIIPLLSQMINGKIITPETLPSQLNKHYTGYIALRSLPYLVKDHFIEPIAPCIFSVSEQKKQLWRNRMQPYLRKVNIGISLLSSPQHYRRRFPIELIQSWSHPDITFFLIQDHLPDEMREFIETNDGYVFYENGIKDFEDSAAMLKHCNLFIGLDSSMAHLSATQGIRTIMLSPNPPTWRFPDRKLNDKNAADSLWYPKMKIFRQPTQGDWDSVAKKVKLELMQIFNMQY